MDTLKDQQWLESLHEDGQRPVAGVGPEPRSHGSASSSPASLWLMLPLLLGRPEASAARVLAIGAHPDDIEIGCGGTIMKLIEEGAISEVRWVVLSGEGERAQEARRSAEAILERVPGSEVVICDFLDGFFPYEGSEDQGVLRGAEGRFRARPGLHSSARGPAPGSPPQLRADLEHVPRPPDPRVRGAEVRRRHGRSEHVRPPLRRPRERKIDHLMDHFASQRSKHWFQEDLFRACCGCAAWSATRRAPTPRRSSAARPCSRDRGVDRQARGPGDGCEQRHRRRHVPEAARQGWHVAGVARRPSDEASVVAATRHHPFDRLEEAFRAVPHLRAARAQRRHDQAGGALAGERSGRMATSRRGQPDRDLQRPSGRLGRRAGLERGAWRSTSRPGRPAAPSHIGAPTPPRRRVRSTSSARRRPTSATTAARSAPWTRGSPRRPCRRRSARSTSPTASGSSRAYEEGTSRSPEEVAAAVCELARREPEDLNGRTFRVGAL